MVILIRLLLEVFIEARYDTLGWQWLRIRYYLFALYDISHILAGAIEAQAVEYVEFSQRRPLHHVELLHYLREHPLVL